MLKVSVRVHDKVFAIPCGDGTQDIKWLASVAAKRYELMTARSKGRSRSREPSTNQAGMLRPASVRRKPLSVSLAVAGIESSLATLWCARLVVSVLFLCRDAIKEGVVERLDAKPVGTLLMLRS